MLQLPYFDALFMEIAKGPSEIVAAFGTRHVHWGLFDDPNHPNPSTADLRHAAEQLTKRLTSLANLRDGERVLDAGCGFGGTTASINERFRSMRLTGLNIDARQIERARGLVVAEHHNKIDFVTGDACHMPFAADSFDAVLAVECIFHFPSRLKFFKEARRVLRRGGRLVLSDFVPHVPFIPWLIPFVWARDKEVRSFFGDTNPIVPTRLGYRILASLAGFRLVHDEDITPNTLPTYDVLATYMRDGERAQALAATLRLKEFSKQGYVRYRNLAFEAI